jgi:hypothetical protein
VAVDHIPPPPLLHRSMAMDVRSSMTCEAMNCDQNQVGLGYCYYHCGCDVCINYRKQSEQRRSDLETQDEKSG